MSQKLTISETGLKLIKAFEGYRPVDRELVTGQRIVGYGHRLYSEDAVMMDKGEAEEVLRADLEPFEDMINSEVHAPITQSQFDALCSFAFNIGPKAFLKSDTLRALNNGRPLDAANGLDVWRKSEIAGKTYVVDALMRRRTAEKALFLRTERALPAGREDLPPVKDTTIEGLSTEDGLPVFTEEEAKSVVVSAPYSATISPARRRDDRLAGVMELSEFDTIEDENLAEVEDFAEAENVAEEVSVFEGENDTGWIDIDLKPDPAKDRASPIAAAATDIVARLDALIDDVDTDFDARDTDWPESLVNPDTDMEDTPELGNVETADEAEQDAKVIDLKSRTRRSNDAMADARSSREEQQAAIIDKMEPSAPVIDDLKKSEVNRQRTDSAAKYIETYVPENVVSEPKAVNPLTLWIPVLLGFILLGAAGGTLIRGAEMLLGAWGPIIAFTGFVIGVCLILAGIYARLRISARN